MSLTEKQKARLAKADEIIQQAKSTQLSQQPRFAPVDSTMFLNMTTKWAKELFETPPPYSSDSRQRSKWLDKFWRQEPYLAGVINSVIQIDRNRGWSLVGGRNQVLRFQSVLHNWQVQPGQASWRDGVGAASLAFHTQDIGALVEIGRQFKDGPMAGLFHLDPTRCTLRSNPDEPVYYYPSQGKIVHFTPTDYIRMTSMTSLDETFNGLGYSALSRCMDLAVILTAVWRHEQERLFARAPKGLLLLKGINEEQWKNAMAASDVELTGNEQEWYGAVAVLATSGDADIDAKLMALSELPTGFDQEKFTNLMMYGYAVAFGYDAREFWPVSQGSLGSGRESDIQHRTATGKGGKEFWMGLQEQIQNQLPPTIHFEPEERDADAELADAQLAQAQAVVITSMYKTGIDPMTGESLILTKDETRELYAEKGLIPRDWTAAPEDTEGSDTGEVSQAKLVRQRVLEFPEVQRAIDQYPDEPIVRYVYPHQQVQVLFAHGADALKKYFTPQAGGDTLYKDKTISITSKDVDASIAAAKKRVSPEFAAMLQAGDIKDKPKSKQSRFTGGKHG